MKDILNIFRSGSPKRKVVKHTIMNQLQNELSLVTKDQDLRFRLGGEADLAEFVHLEDQAYQGYLAWRLKDFQADWERNPFAVYLILEQIQVDGQSQILGAVTGRFKPQGAHISHLMVHPDYQGLGYGQLLLDKWIEAVKLIGLPKITLEVRQSNYRAQNLYIGAGFVKGHVKHFYYSDNHEDAFEMVLSLCQK
ncbi:ribosomal protein S18-alanine N-acetyltransferase [Ignavigranum ruoffiae]|uniref:ribosomal protein S18-alanine N-acetyltransferase n=1 Tax=Ignavigranum ruoffiae TaxID=89093 RepID=UPI002352C0CA|nr:ribosomal protein S18-alanine N-acetyltransferase [Ignavigranum ruoffiae]